MIPARRELQVQTCSWLDVWLGMIPARRELQVQTCSWLDVLQFCMEPALMISQLPLFY